MKFFIVVLLTFSTCLFQIKAQQIKFGFNGGVNMNFPRYNMAGDSLNAQEAGGIGGHGGVFFEYAFSKDLVLMSELNLMVTPFNTFNRSEDVRTNWSMIDEHRGLIVPVSVQLPIMAKYLISFRKGRYGAKHDLGFFGGVAAGYTLSQSHYVERTTVITSLNQSTTHIATNDNLQYNPKPFDINLVVGTMFDFEFGLRLGVRYQLGLLSYSDAPISLKMNTLNFSLGYAIFDNKRR